jgi:hypothetical protein
MVAKTKHNKFKGMQKETVTASFKVLTWYFPGGTEESHNRAQPA